VISGGDNPYDIHDAKLSSSATAHESSSVTAHEISNTWQLLRNLTSVILLQSLHRNGSKKNPFSRESNASDSTVNSADVSFLQYGQR
ncbi:hypothetical protein ACTQ41_03125, partial [Bacillota bacterium LCP21S3_D8]